jgi:hypothetical protein
MPERSQFTGVFALSNGNYLAYGWNGYGSGSDNFANSAGSNRNEVYIAEFTESGNLLRYKAIPANFSTIYGKRTFITHSRVVERLNDGGLLILSEFNHGLYGVWQSTYMSDCFNRIILDKDWNVTANGLFSINAYSYRYNGSNLSATVVGMRTMDITHTGDGRLIACYKCDRYLSGDRFMQGVVFLDYDGVPSSPDGHPAVRIIEDNVGTRATVSIVRNGNHYLITENGTGIWRSTDLNCTGFVRLSNMSCSASYCHNDRAKDVIPLPNSGGFAVHGPTAIYNDYYTDPISQYGIWRWNSSLTAESAYPIRLDNNRLLYGFTLMNNAVYEANSQDRYLVKSENYVSNSSTNILSRKIAQLVFSASGTPVLTEGPNLSAPDLEMKIFSIDSSGIICGGTTKVGGVPRMIVGKMSTCKDFTLTPNKSYISGVALPEFTFYVNGEYPGAKISYSWRVLLKSGKLESPYSGATVGTVLASGTGNTIPQTVFTADLSEAKPAVLLVEYSATQRWGTPQQLCKVSSSYEITLVSAPDNVVNTFCDTPPTGVPWGGMLPAYSVQQNLVPHQSVTVGDIDGDGAVEILAAADPVDNAAESLRRASKIAIYKGNSISTPAKEISTADFNWNYRTKFGAVRTRISGKDTTLIVVACADRRLRAYNYNGAEVWVSSSSSPYYYHASLNDGLSPAFADVNHDGIPEIAIGGKLYNSGNGAWICEIPAATCPFINDKESMNVQIVDVYNNGSMKYVVGNCIYNINIDVSTNVIQSLTLDRKIQTGGSAGCPDGGKSLFVDIDRDGAPDMIVAHAHSSYVTLYIANPVTDQIRAAVDIPASSYCGYPAVGDVNGDGENEIVLVTAGTGDNRFIRCYKYNGMPTLTAPWSAIAHNDDSGSTGLTLFDLDSDGSVEIIHRDNTGLRVIDGKNSSSYPGRNKSTYPNLSGTGAEYPVVADVDGDGHAEIVIVGGLDSDADNTYKGHLWIFKSGDPAGSPWAAARKVWNQYSYHPVYVNENLTVPKYPQNPATIFPGDNSQLDGGGGDDVQPYNNYMQQQTLLNIDGRPFRYAPDIQFITNPAPVFTYYGTGDSLVVSMQLRNTGQAALTSPFHISAYRNEVLVMNRMAAGVYYISVAPGAVQTVKLKIPDISTYAANKIILRLNNMTGTGYAQAECNYGNNDYEYSPSSIPRAVNDTAVTVVNTALSVDVRQNDDLSSCPASVPSIKTGSGPFHGTAAIAGNNVVYTPDNGFYGVDSLVYRLTCNMNPTEAKVYIIVNKPVATPYINCSGKNVAAGFTAIADVTYFWYEVETGGVPSPSTAALTKDCTAPSVQYVEVRYGGKPVKPRLTVTVSAYPPLDAGEISTASSTVCYGKPPAPFTSLSPASGGDGKYVYDWQYKTENGLNWNYAYIDALDYTSTAALQQTTLYRRVVRDGCGDFVHAGPLTVTVRSAALYNYPDLRIRACPDAGTTISLSKYIDTLDVSGIQWSSPVNADGSIAASLIAYSNVRTFTYTVTNPCLGEPLSRKIYLETLKSQRMRPLRDTVEICCETAEAVQINQIFGIDAGEGTWSYMSSAAGDVNAYVKVSQSPEYSGAVIMNGKAVYYESSIGYYPYRGMNDAKKVEFIYTPADGSCLNGQTFKVVIILTKN